MKGKVALNKARGTVAQLLEEQETNAQKVRFDIETRGRSGLVSAESEARAQRRLAQDSPVARPRLCSSPLPLACYGRMDAL